VPFGSNCYGVESASQTYFKKSVSDISINEAALLASLIKAPTYFSPYGKHKDELLARKNYILSRMEILNYISKEKSDELKNSEIEFEKQITSIIKAPHFVLYVKKQLEQEYGTDFLKQKGLKVYTTLNWELQEEAETIITEKSKINENHNAFNAALVSVSPKTGEILTMVGSKDYFGESYPKDCIPRKDCLFEPDFNITTLSNRQPGSAFKPFAYAKAFEKGFTPDTMLWDVMTNFGVWGAEPYIPENYDGKFRGPISLRNALARSINVPSVKVLYMAGIRDTISFAKSLGITTLNEKSSFYGLSLVLGGGEVKLLDITSAYGVFANRGLKITPQTILKIEDLNGNTIKENKKTGQRILETNIADLMNDILSDNKARTPVFGPYSALHISGYDVAAKTGTTQEYKDAWTIGYTPSIVTGVWVGNNDNSPMDEEPGVVLAGPIWNSFMKKAIDYFPKENFHKPKSNSSEKPILLGTVDMEDPHSILHYLNKNDPQGDELQNPEEDSQYVGWEAGIRLWLDTHQ
jgi:membrane peptidoglycan carboxypeptidase